LVKKGGTVHRRSGLLFVYAMLVMGISASLLGNVGGGVMTVYFVGTALTTVRPVSAWTRTFDVAALMVVVGLALLAIGDGVKAFNSPGGVLNGVPFVMHFFLATVMILAAGWRRAHHAIRRASWRAAPGAPFVADVLRAVYRGRIVLLDP